jgi:outer membrane protein assembly factor BamB
MKGTSVESKRRGVVLVENLYENLYAASEQGEVFILRSGPELETAAEWQMKESIYATPAVAGGRLYLRTWEALYAIGGKE